MVMVAQQCLKGFINWLGLGGIIVINGYGLSETAPVIAQALFKASTLNWPEDKKENYLMKGA